MNIFRSIKTISKNSPQKQIQSKFDKSLKVARKTYTTMSIEYTENRSREYHQPYLVH